MSGMVWHGPEKVVPGGRTSSSTCPPSSPKNEPRATTGPVAPARRSAKTTRATIADPRGVDRAHPVGLEAGTVVGHRRTDTSPSPSSRKSPSGYHCSTAAQPQHRAGGRPVGFAVAQAERRPPQPAHDGGGHSRVMRGPTRRSTPTTARSASPAPAMAGRPRRSPARHRPRPPLTGRVPDEHPASSRQVSYHHRSPMKIAVDSRISVGQAVGVTPGDSGRSVPTSCGPPSMGTTTHAISRSASAQLSAVGWKKE